MRTAPLKKTKTKKKVQVLKAQGPLCHLIKLEVSYMTFSLKLVPPPYSVRLVIPAERSQVAFTSQKAK